MTNLKPINKVDMILSDVERSIEKAKEHLELSIDGWSAEYQAHQLQESMENVISAIQKIKDVLETLNDRTA